MPELQATRVAAATTHSLTRATHARAVERVIDVLRERFSEPLSLDDMARIAISSPFHFNRVFRQVTGLPPGRFLSALRLEAAKRLLLTTRFSVTSICFMVGYNSLGTFTTHFTEDVGTPPNRLRRLQGKGRAGSSGATRQLPIAPVEPGGELRGVIRAPVGFSGRAMIGLFASPLPRGRPAACAVVDAPGEYRLSAVSDGRWHVLAVGLDRNASVKESLTHLLPRGRGGPVTVTDGCVSGSPDVVLREPSITDPPILVSLSMLLDEHARSD
jgi:AraC family transcriptional regulator